MNAQAIIDLARNPVIKDQVAKVIYHLKPDPWFYLGIGWHICGYRDKEAWMSAWTFLLAFAQEQKPKTYLETGVRKGGSMALVLSQSPGTVCYGFDLWPEDYAKVEGWPHTPASPELVMENLKPGIPEVNFVSGDSKETLPAFLKNHPGFRCDLAFVDGEHSYEGAKRDLENAFTFADVVLFDDIFHPLHPTLKQAWDECYEPHKEEYPFAVIDGWNVGTAAAFHKNLVS